MLKKVAEKSLFYSKVTEKSDKYSKKYSKKQNAKKSVTANKSMILPFDKVLGH